MTQAMTINETANMLRVSPSMIRKMIAADDLPHVRFGKRVIIDKEDLDTWINARKRGGIHDGIVDKENNRIGQKRLG